jgi:hypothetical protein
MAPGVVSPIFDQLAKTLDYAVAWCTLIHGFPWWSGSSSPRSLPTPLRWVQVYYAKLFRRRQDLPLWFYHMLTFDDCRAHLLCRVLSRCIHSQGACRNAVQGTISSIPSTHSMTNVYLGRLTPSGQRPADPFCLPTLSTNGQEGPRAS